MRENIVDVELAEGFREIIVSLINDNQVTHLEAVKFQIVVHDDDEYSCQVSSAITTDNIDLTDSFDSELNGPFFDLMWPLVAIYSYEELDSFDFVIFVDPQKHREMYDEQSKNSALSLITC